MRTRLRRQSLAAVCRSCCVAALSEPFRPCSFSRAIGPWVKRCNRSWLPFRLRDDLQTDSVVAAISLLAPGRAAPNEHQPFGQIKTTYRYRLMLPASRPLLLG